ncbi:hypothetical protein NE237_021362 [Protea cynaroides]|uniref:Uncharacterized protein n=1 Tax=Protea cynaroides TaxID=273540 RepID=A0A9Q0HC97_9MAGN|nr:hypothetical protein NE237_021362 [Protea cynaroides]
MLLSLETGEQRAYLGSGEATSALEAEIRGNEAEVRLGRWVRLVACLVGEANRRSQNEMNLPSNHGLSWAESLFCIVQDQSLIMSLVISMELLLYSSKFSSNDTLHRGIHGICLCRQGRVSKGERGMFMKRRKNEDLL